VILSVLVIALVTSELVQTCERALVRRR